MEDLEQIAVAAKEQGTFTQLEPQLMGIIKRKLTSKPTPCHSPIRWAGGKSSQLAIFNQFLPVQTGTLLGERKNYYELFTGGGALFFEKLYNTFSVLVDKNAALINFYTVLSKKNAFFLNSCYRLERAYNNAPTNIQQDIYYAVREQYNSISEHLSLKHPKLWEETNAHIDLNLWALYFYFLNKTGFNGVFRVNSKGGFNIPFGRKTKISLLNDNLYQVMSTLAVNASLLYADFEVTEGVHLEGKQGKVHFCSRPNAGDLIYCDPPYIQQSTHTRYTEQDFTLEDHARLFQYCQKLIDRGCLVMLSNSDTPKTRELAYSLAPSLQCYEVPSVRKVRPQDGIKQTIDLLFTNLRKV